MSKIEDIVFNVHLDDDSIPEKITWEASDADSDGKKECNGVMISLWEPTERATMGIDLWVKEMTVNDMSIFFHQTLLKMSDTYYKATGSEEIKKHLESSAAEFAYLTGILDKK